MSEWQDYPISLLGKRVKVLLDRHGHPEEIVVIRGKFLGFGQNGTFEILEDDGDIHYCWANVGDRA